MKRKLSLDLYLFMRDYELSEGVMRHVQSFFELYLNRSIILRSAFGPILVTFALKGKT